MENIAFQKIHQETSLKILEEHYGVKGREAVSVAVSSDSDIPLGIKFELKCLMSSIKSYGYLISEKSR